MRDLAKEINESFWPALYDKSEISILYGGAGSGKSYAASQKLIVRAFNEPGHRFIVARKIGRTLRQSVFQRIKSQLAAWELLPFCMVNKSDMVITTCTGSEFVFVGVDDVDKLKSIDEISGAWIEEATEFTFDDFLQLLLRVRGDTLAGYAQILLTFNPILETHWLNEKLFKEPPMEWNVSIHHSTVEDNPRVSERYVRTLDGLKNLSPEFYNVYRLGKWGNFAGRVFQDPVEIDEFPRVSELELTAFGLDFGFNNPCAFIRIGIDKYDPVAQTLDLYVDEVVYESGLTTPQLNEAMRAEFDPDEIDEMVYGDSEAPGEISELADAGWPIVSCTKGPGSVRAGISALMKCRVFATKRSVNFLREWKTYCWAKDREGKMLDVPVKAFDHSIDAVRYAVRDSLSQLSGGFGLSGGPDDEEDIDDVA